MKIIKKDKFGRRHVSGIVTSQKLTSSEIFQITKESVFLIVFKAQNNEESQYMGNGTAFLNPKLVLKFKDKEIDIKEAIIPKRIYYQFERNYLLLRHLDFSIIKIKIDDTRPLNFFL